VSFLFVGNKETSETPHQPWSKTPLNVQPITNPHKSLFLLRLCHSPKSGYPVNEAVLRKLSIALRVAAYGVALLLCLAPVLISCCIRPCCADHATDCCPSTPVAASAESEAASPTAGRHAASGGESFIAAPQRSGPLPFARPNQDRLRSASDPPPGGPAPSVILRI